MDIKQLYIKTQKTVLNWGLIVSALFFIATLSSFVIKNAPRTMSVWLSFTAYAIILTSTIITRMKINKKAALFGLISFTIFSIYSLIDSLIRFKSVAKIQQEMGGLTTNSLIYGYILGTVILLAINFLYYKVYKATDNILSVRDEQGIQ